MMTKTTVYDKLGQAMQVGSIVAVPNSATKMQICRLTKIMPKLIKVSRLNNTGYQSSSNKYPSEVICLDAIEETVMYILTSDLKER